MLLAVLLVGVAAAEGNSIAAAEERPDSNALDESGRQMPAEARAAEIGGSLVLWVLGGGLVVVSLVARRRRSVGFPFRTPKR
jgi:hypothetical protein